MWCSPRTIELEEERLSLVKKHFGDVPLSAITATSIAEFQRTRHDAGIANRTINMGVGVLSRVLKSCGRWRALADHVKNLPERQRPVGRALTPEERKRLFDAAASNAEWEHVFCAAVVAANTSMRPVEVKHLRRCDVDLVKRLVHVRRSKNETSHRVIPLNASAIEAAARMFERADLLGHTEPEHYLWPACQWGRCDATSPMLKWDTAWRALRDAAGLQGLRFHDLRHTAITELAEMGVADHVLESISGHLSRRMLEHYSHIRIDAKRQALDALDAARRSTAHNGDGNGDGASQTEIPAIVEVADDLTSQSRHSLLLQGSPPSGKLLIPLAGEMSEWLKEHAWKACVGETLPRVRIPLSPPICESSAGASVPSIGEPPSSPPKVGRPWAVAGTRARVRRCSTPRLGGAQGTTSTHEQGRRRVDVNPVLSDYGMLDANHFVIDR